VTGHRLRSPPRRMWTKCLLALFLAFSVGTPALSQAGQTDWSTAITHAKPAVVRIVVETSEGTASGSGVVIAEDGLILTAAHVIEGASQITVVVEETHEYQATVVQSDLEADVAVLRIPASGLEYLTLGDSEDLAYYEEICVLGYSRPSIGVGFIPARGYFIGLRTSPSASYLQFEATPLDYGHSGGPVIDARGHVVGIVVRVVADLELGVFNKLAVTTDTVNEVRARSPVRSQRALVHSEDVFSVTFSPDGRLLASGSGDNTVKLWDVATGALVRTLTGHSVAFSPDGGLLASGSLDNTVKLWDVATGALARTLAGHINSVASVAFSPDGRRLASGSVDNTVKLWDVATGEELRVLAGHTLIVDSVAFSPDGRLVASGSFGTTILLWDVATGALVRSLAGHTSWISVTSVAFSPDGRLLASGSGDETVKLWDVATGREVRTLSGHSDCVWSVAFSPDGRLLASASSDCTVRLWPVEEGE